MSKLGSMVLNNPLCNTPDMQEFLKRIEATFERFPEDMKQVVDEDLVKVFEKGLVLGLHHFNDDAQDEYEE